MNIALLGLGTVGYNTYDAIINKEGSIFEDGDINICYCLVKDPSKHTNIEPAILTTDYQKILDDVSIDTVIEMMGSNISYDYIKRALEKKKNVITANKEVIAEHFSELEKLSQENNVSILYEAAVGGGIPVITTLSNLTPVNRITRIEGILNGTTNYILTNMHIEKTSFDEALKSAQEKGFAEADPSSDLLGLDMVRKITILSQIAYQSEIDIKDVYSYGITGLNKEIVDVISLLGYTLKFMCYSALEDGKITIAVEPVVFKRSDIFASVSYEYNAVRYTGDHCGVQIVIGKGAGPKTANSILNDIKLLKNGYRSTYKIRNSYQVIGQSQDVSKYFIKHSIDIDPTFIETSLGSYALTRDLTFEELSSIKDKLDFFARVKDKADTM